VPKEDAREKGGMGDHKNWRPAFALLHKDGFLFYAANENDKEALGVVSLAGCAVLKTQLSKPVQITHSGSSANLGRRESKTPDPRKDSKTSETPRASESTKTHEVQFYDIILDHPASRTFFLRLDEEKLRDDWMESLKEIIKQQKELDKEAEKEEKAKKAAAQEKKPDSRASVKATDTKALEMAPINEQSVKVEVHDEPHEKQAQWVEHFTDDGFAYYENTQSGECTWEKPDGFVVGTPMSGLPTMRKDAGHAGLDDGLFDAPQDPGWASDEKSPTPDQKAE
jgi:hypothetical protein